MPEEGASAACVLLGLRLFPELEELTMELQLARQAADLPEDDAAAHWRGPGGEPVYQFLAGWIDDNLLRMLRSPLPAARPPGLKRVRLILPAAAADGHAWSGAEGGVADGVTHACCRELAAALPGPSIEFVDTE
jgi:dipeptidyl aminopeptidase/acylaminoacyl peptidase